MGLLGVASVLVGAATLVACSTGICKLIETWEHLPVLCYPQITSPASGWQAGCQTG
jgi:hypothetical protein